MTERILITGGPRTGKSTLGRELDPHYLETDQPYREGKAWSDVSDHVSYWFDRPGPWVIEGVAVPRALRKWLARHPGSLTRPCDRVIFLTNEPFEPSKGREAMAKGVLSVWREVLPELRRRGVPLELRNVPFDPSKVSR
jgi:hypothetical protein